MADKKSKTIELVLKVVNLAGKSLERANAQLNKVAIAERKAAQAAKAHGQAQVKSSKQIQTKGTSAQKATDQVLKMWGAESKAVKTARKLATTTKKATREVKKLGRESERAGKSVKKMGGSVGTMVADFGRLIGAMGTIAAPVLVFGTFERSMAEVGAVANATEGELDKLKRKAMELGSTTERTASEVASGMKFMSMAGFSVQQTYESISGVLNLAKAGAMDLGAAADIATNILTGFGFAASELGMVNDVLVTAFTSTNSTLTELGTALAYVGPIANGLGADFEDLVAAIGLLHNAGLKGTMAGTALRSVLDTLFNPTKDEAQQLAVLSERLGGVGLQVIKTTGDFIGFADIIEQLERAGVTGAEALALFGMRAGPGMGALLSQGSKALTKLTTKFKDSEGRTDALAKKMGENLKGSFLKLTSAMEGFMIRIGEKLAPAIEKGITAITGFIEHMNIWIEANPELASGIIKVTGAVIGLIAAISALKIASAAFTFLSPNFLKKAGTTSAALYMTSFSAGTKMAVRDMGPRFTGWMTKALKGVGTALTTLLPTFAIFSAKAAGMFASMGKGIVAGFKFVIPKIAGIFKSLGSILVGRLSLVVKNIGGFLLQKVPLVFAGAFTAGVATATSVLTGGLTALFAGFKIGTLIEPWVSSIELLFTNLNIGEVLQAMIAKVVQFFSTTTGLFADFVNSIIKWGKKIPGLGKLLGWADDKTGATKAMDSIIAKTDEFSEHQQRIVDGIYNEADARDEAHKREEALADRKMAMYKEINEINKEFDPDISKAQADLSTYQKKFARLRSMARTTANGIRDALTSVGETLRTQIADNFSNVGSSTAVKQLYSELSRLNRDYLDESKQKAEEIRQVENEIGNARVSATIEVMEKGIAAEEALSQKRIQLEEAAIAKIIQSKEGQLLSEQKLADKIKLISAEAASAKRNVYVQASQAIQKELDRSIAKEEELANKLKGLISLLKGAVASIESQQRGIERSIMTPAQLYRDQLKEVKEVLAAGDRALAAGDINTAVELWNKSATLAASTAKEIKDGDRILVTGSQAAATAMQATEKAKQRIIQYGGKYVEQTRKEADAQKELTDTMQASFDSIQKEVLKLDDLIKDGLTVKLEIDLKGWNAQMDKLIKENTAVVTISADVNKAYEAVKAEQLKKEEAMIDRLQNKYSDLIEDSVDYQKAWATAHDGTAAGFESSKGKADEFAETIKAVGVRGAISIQPLEEKILDFGKAVEIKAIPVVKKLQSTFKTIDFGVGKKLDWLDEIKDKKMSVRVGIEGRDKANELVEVVKQLVNVTFDIIANVIGLDTVKELRDVIADLKDKTITVTTINKTVNEGGEGYASGGSVFRRLTNPFITAGSGRKDDVPAMLKKKEFVQPAGAVAKYGLGFMERIRRGLFPEGLARMFATGGLVTPFPSMDMGNISRFALAPGFATGGSVKQGTGDIPHLGQIDLKIGSKSYPALFERDVVEELSTVLLREGLMRSN